MRALKPEDIRGNWATLLTVWNADGSIDLGRIEAEIDALIEAGVDGIYSNGTAGEFHSQTDKEFAFVSEMFSEKCEAANMPYQIGVSHMSATISRKRLTRIKDLAPGAVQIILPDWFPVNDEEALRFLQGMEETADGIGMVLYNPPHAKRVLRPREIGRLAEKVPGLVGVKSAGGEDDWYEEMRLCIPNLSVFIPGHFLASGVTRGAAGAYSNVACLHPGAAQRWTDLISTDLSAALEIEGRIRRFMETYIVPFITVGGYSNAACDRLLALIGGWTDVGTEMRWPYQSIPTGESVRLRAKAVEGIPEFVGAEPIIGDFGASTGEDI